MEPLLEKGSRKWKLEMASRWLRWLIMMVFAGVALTHFFSTLPAYAALIVVAGVSAFLYRLYYRAVDSSAEYQRREQEGNASIYADLIAVSVEEARVKMEQAFASEESFAITPASEPLSAELMGMLPPTLRDFYTRYESVENVLLEVELSRRHVFSLKDSFPGYICVGELPLDEAILAVKPDSDTLYVFDEGDDLPEYPSLYHYLYYHAGFLPWLKKKSEV